MTLDSTLLALLGRIILINVVPFFLVFHLVMKRRKHHLGEKNNELDLIASEIIIVGILGYFIILSIYFFSIPVLLHTQSTSKYNIMLVEPDGHIVFYVAYFSYALVVCGIYLKAKKIWAHRALLLILCLLLFFGYFTILELGLIAFVPIALFSYLLFRLTRPGLKKELFRKN